VHGDFDSDGFLDLALLETNRLEVFKGSGNGLFTLMTTLTTGSSFVALAAVDLRGIGRKDLVAMNSSSNFARVFRSRGDGTFETLADFTIAGSGRPKAIVFGDYDRDGRLDMAIAKTTSNTVAIAYGDGMGAFRATLNTYSIGSGTGPSSIASGDLNGDFILDLAVANLDNGSFSILIGNSNGTFQAPANYAFDGISLNGIQIGYFNSDNLPDLALLDIGQNQLSILSGLGNGTFDWVSPRNIGTVDLPTGLASADFDSDGKLDLITISSSTNEYKIYLGTRLSTSFTGLTSVSLTANPNAIGNGIVVGDFNNDRKADIVALDTAENRTQMLLGN
jgi:hypothetical protein